MTEPLSIGMVCFPTLGGSGIIGAELAVGLARHGHRVHVIASAPPTRALPAGDRLSFHQVAVPSYPSLDPSPYALALTSSLVEIIARHRLDVVHVHYAVPHATSAYLARQVVRGLGDPPRIVTTLHGTDVTQVGSDPSYRSVTRFAVSQSDGVTAPSEFLRRETYRLLGVPAEMHIEVIPNFVNTDHFTPAARRDRTRFDDLFAVPGGKTSQPDGPVLFHVSSFRAVKRAADLVDVLVGVRKHVPARLVLVGDGPELSGVKQRVRDLGVAGCVSFAGARADFVDYLRHADAFVLSSESESFGVAALEALSCGVPVVAYEVGGLDELVTAEVGRLVSPFDVEALTAAVLDVVTHDDVRNALGRAGRTRAEAHFRVEPALDRYESYYRRVLAAVPKGDS